jgi:hypothetical protein
MSRLFSRAVVIAGGFTGGIRVCESCIVEACALDEQKIINLE